MKNTFTGIVFKDCGTGFSMPKDHEGDEFSNINFENCDAGFVYRDEPSILSSLGLPLDTPIAELIDVLETLKAHEKADEYQKNIVIKESKLGGFINGAVNATSIAANLVTISALPQLEPLLAALKAFSKS